jgi:uncharacterized Tic20 family protein
MDMNDTLPPIQPAGFPAATSTRSWEVMCHLSSLIALIGVPFGNVLGPVLVWLIKRDASPGVDAHGKEAVNFHLSWTLYWLVSTTVVGILCVFLIGLLLIPFLILAYLVGIVAMLILSIVAAVKAGNGQLYRYPLTIRFLT